MLESESIGIKELLRAKLSLVRGELDEALGRISQDMIDWAPAEGVRTISGQLVEIAATEFQTIAFVTEGRTVSDAEAEQAFGDCHSLANLRDVLVSVRQQTLHVLDSYSTQELEEQAVIKRAWFVSSYLPKVPRAEVFQSIAAHEWYHLGQLVTYLWIRGDDPYKW